MTTEKPASQSVTDVLNPGSGPKSNAGGAEPALGADYYAARGAAYITQMGMATLLAKSDFDRRLSVVQVTVGARAVEQRTELEVAMVWYFSAHGTSPETPWATYDKPFVFEGRTFQANKIVEPIGSGRLKQFMARFSRHVLGLFNSSAEYRRVLAERASRLGLDPEDAIFAVDFYGKDGSLDSASMGKKAMVRNRALNYRASNAMGVMTQSRSSDANDRNDKPPVVPTGLRTSFRDPQR